MRMLHQRLVHPASKQVPTAVERQHRCLLFAFRWRRARPCPRPCGALRTAATASPLNRTRPSQQDSQTFRDKNLDASLKLTVAGDVGSARITPDAQSAARSLFAALNRRDVSSVLSLLADDITYENLGSSTVLRGRAAVGRFYLEALAALPEDASFVLEGPDGGGTDPWVGHEGGAASGPALQAGVAWHVELNGLVVPLSRGVSVYWVEPRTGRLARILDSPEHPVKQSAPSLTSAPWGSPLLAGLGPLAIPAATSVTSFWNNVIPGGGGGGGSTGGGGPNAAGSGLAGTFLTALGSVLPIQASSFGQPTAGVSRSNGRTGGGSDSKSGGAVAAAGGGGGDGRGVVLFRDHTGSAGNGIGGGGGGGGGRRARSAAAVATAAAAAASAAVGASVRAPGAQLGAAGLRATSVGDSNVAVAAPPASVPAANPASSSTAAAAVARKSISAQSTTLTPNDRSQEPIRMRLLPDPKPPPRRSLSSASVSVASSLAASLSDGDEDDDGDASAGLISATASGSRRTTPSSATKPAAVSVASTTARSISVRSANGSSGTTAGGGGSSGGGSGGSSSSVFASVDSGSDSDTGDTGGGGGGSGPTPPPFPRSTSQMANLTGLWEKDVSASQVEEYESMLDVLQLGGLQKVTARLIDGLDLRQDDERFEVSFVTVVPFFRVTEGSRFDRTSSMMRRDLRPGRQTAQAARVPGGVVVDMEWEAPLAGSLREEYVVSEDGAAMSVTSTLKIGTRTAVATQVYRRSSSNKSDFLASKRSSYGSLTDVLQSQEQKYGKLEY